MEVNYHVKRQHSAIFAQIRRVTLTKGDIYINNAHYIKYYKTITILSIHYVIYFIITLWHCNFVTRMRLHASTLCN